MYISCFVTRKSIDRRMHTMFTLIWYAGSKTSGNCVGSANGYETSAATRGLEEATCWTQGTLKTFVKSSLGSRWKCCAGI
jgi:hypothetical protein